MLGQMGQPGAISRSAKGRGKGGFSSKRKMPLKGLRKGVYIMVSYREKKVNIESYREKKAPGMLDERVDYEGTIVDKRVGWHNRESYVELEDCLRLNAGGEIVAKEGTKRLFDAFIDECEEVEKVDRPLSSQLAAMLRSVQSVVAGPSQAAVVPSLWENLLGSGRPLGSESMLQTMAGAATSSTEPAADVSATSMMLAMPMGMGMGMGMGSMQMMGMGMGGMPMCMVPAMGMGGMSMGMMPAHMMGMMPMPMMGMMPMGAAPQMGNMAMPMMGMVAAGAVQDSEGALPMSSGSAPMPSGSDMQPALPSNAMPAVENFQLQCAADAAITDTPEPTTAEPQRRSRSRSRG